MMRLYDIIIYIRSRNEQRTVSIAQETEIVVQGIPVYAAPIAMHKCADQQQQGALRLMKVGDEHLHNLIVIARSNDDLRTAMKHVDGMAVKIINDMLLWLLRSEPGMCVIRLPLPHMQLLFVGVRVGGQLGSDIVKTL